ncbi:MAG: hypothetical protein ACE5IB_05400 [Candidatus Geothermarchaeales archaeon]
MSNRLNPDLTCDESAGFKILRRSQVLGSKSYPYAPVDVIIVDDAKTADIPVGTAFICMRVED